MYIIKKVILYTGCSIPPLLFYLLIKDNASPPTYMILSLAFLQLLIPVAFDAIDTRLDMTIGALIAVVTTCRMFMYLIQRQQGKQIQPFYEVLSIWNQVYPLPNLKQEPSLDQIRHDAARFLIRAGMYILIYIPLFGFMDGFVRVCQEPPESLNTTDAYLSRVWTLGHPSFKFLFYYFWTGITLTLHIVIIPLLHLVFHAIQLNLVIWLPFHHKLRVRLHHDLAQFVAQPPLFTKPWLTRSVHDLWSRRWHQVFRSGFLQLAYSPVRRWFTNKTIGRCAGTMAVFICSGLMHDYLILAMMGYSSPKKGVWGHQTLFFTLQGVGTLVSLKSPRLPTWLAWLLTWIWIVYTAPIFLEPYIRLGYHHFAQVPGFPNFLDPLMGKLCPFGNK
ncbi:hypothetical protein CU098_008622 [Rhizopus stolonifer]|uniref:Wax synthase domain-containing protein n=1 Tax=Rhizopus stolonifer TaxID=4846 RepID=A0A367KK70_RHIST|nr:hypothetical protein CU098_008622 [Rhizopus stolonifer]